MNSSTGDRTAEQRWRTAQINDQRLCIIGPHISTLTQQIADLRAENRRLRQELGI